MKVENMGLLKIDFSNAFNSVSRDVLLSECREHAVELYPFVKWCYSTPSTLWINDCVIASQEGVQQGDPLGPFLFCLVLRLLIRRISNSCHDIKLNSWYLDDDVIIGDSSDLIRVLDIINTD